ncbi:T9SS type A sorting domain-containing protein [Kordia sp.]|uniref:T9SS type A sorting domain-containing protein n=1 Tax=Kordia sp. TaxID=1965332 RepID=UPI003D6A1B78
MTKRSLLYIIAILFSCVLLAQDTKKVLFLGNSYTASNNLPSMISSMATSTGNTLTYDSNTPGGYRFMNHVSNTTTINKINANNWDFVALQAQSQETSWEQSQMEVELYPHAASLINTIRTNNACTLPLFYMTWGRENGDANNCAAIPWVCTYEGMDDAIRATYILMAEQNNAQVSPVGAVWRYLRTNVPNIDLYTGDGSHPSLAGSYAAACAFYTMIFKKDPTLITWNSSLPITTANAIKLAAKTIVFDDLNAWDFTAYFNHVTNIDEVTFASENDYENVTWNFGDTNSSTQENPVHTYAAIGDYQVTLTVTKCGVEHTYTKTISITALSISDPTIDKIEIYPNPVKNEIHIKNTSNPVINIEIFDVNGKLVLTKKNELEVITINELGSGIYFMKLYTQNSNSSWKFIKE